jgi:hypothetical protein
MTSQCWSGRYVRRGIIFICCRLSIPLCFSNQKILSTSQIISSFIYGNINAPGYLFTKHLATTIEILIFLYTQMNASMLQIEIRVLLHAGVLSFDHFEWVMEEL